MIKPSLSEQLCGRYPSLSVNKDSIDAAAGIIIESCSNGGKLMICGNGGSSSDADHMVGELMKSFELKRPLQKDLKNKILEVDPSRGGYLSRKLECGIPALSLSAHTSLSTAIANDIDSNLIFAQQINVLGTEKDILIAISCSGNSQNVIDACIVARALKVKVIGLTGKTGGNLKQFCDILINVPEERTSVVQELHLPVIHTICLIVEDHFYGH